MLDFPLPYSSVDEGEPQYWFDSLDLLKKYRDFTERDVWYCSRNGDRMFCLMPKGSKREDVPKMWLGYMSLGAKKI